MVAHAPAPGVGASPRPSAPLHQVYIEGRPFKLDAAKSIGKGGEADVFGLDAQRAVKVWKSPEHPDFDGFPEEQRAAEARIELHQRKMREFPTGLPAAVVTPLSLATDRTGARILGYVMPLVAGATSLMSLAEPARRAVTPSDWLLGVFRGLHHTLLGLHARSVVVGDFNDLNVLVTPGGEPRVIDCDSFQFGPYLCPVFTERFVDPLLCDAAASSPKPRRPFDSNADWYAFNVLLFQALLSVGPYGGVHRPKDPTRRVAHGARPLHRVTVFDADVQYPKPARPVAVLPDELLEHFRAVFERDQRGVFPRALLERTTFAACARCGLEHARLLCPSCARPTQLPPLAALAAAGSRASSGVVTATELFKTTGVIVHVALVDGALVVVHHEAGAYRREDGRVVMAGAFDPRLRFRIAGEDTWVARDTELVRLRDGASPQRLSVDATAMGPRFETHGATCVWVDQGRLLSAAPSRFDEAATELIGDVLPNQTQFWLGSTFGAGFYRAGGLCRFFVFDVERKGINDELVVPPLPGELVSASGALSESHAWLFLALKHAGRLRHVCLVYSRRGQLLATAEGEPGDGTFLGSLTGFAAVGGALFAPTDAGIVRLEIEAGAIKKVREFPDTEPYVDAASGLHASRQGIFVASRRTIVRLEMK